MDHCFWLAPPGSVLSLSLASLSSSMKPRLHVALLQPRSARNVGAIGRSSVVAGGVRIHLVRPLGFSYDAHHQSTSNDHSEGISPRYSSPDSVNVTAVNASLRGPVERGVGAEKELVQSGLDYWSRADVRVHDSVDALWDEIGMKLDFKGPEHEQVGSNQGDGNNAGERGRGRAVLFTTRAALPYFDFTFREGDLLLFGSESCGAPESVHRDPRVTSVTIPRAFSESSGGLERSLNLATTVSIGVFEALRQLTLRQRQDAS